MSLAPFPLQDAPAADDGEKEQPPALDEAELALLSGILAKSEVLVEVDDLLEPEHFSNPYFGRIYGICRDRFNEGRPASALTLSHHLAGDPDFAAYGGADFLQELQESWVQLSDLRGYAQTIRDVYLRRQIVELTEEAAEEARHPRPEQTAEGQLEALEERIFRLGETGEIHAHLEPLKDGLKRAAEWAESARRKDEKARPVSTGLHALNRIISGFFRSDLVILAGRPSMGKTGLATTLALTAARQKSADGRKRTVAFFSLEMSHEQLAGRLLAMSSGVQSDKLRSGELTDSEFDRIHTASRELESLQLYVDDSGNSNIGSIRSRARRIKRVVGGLDLIVVDYLQLVQSNRRWENRVQEVSEITRGLKAMAKDLDVPVLALSQLSRAVDGRDSKRPTLSDLRDSGTIEQDADIVMFIFREQYYLEKNRPVRRDEESETAFDDRCRRHEERLEKAHNEAELNIAKHRHGSTGTARVFFDHPTTAFRDEEPNAPPAPPPEGPGGEGDAFSDSF